MPANQAKKDAEEADKFRKRLRESILDVKTVLENQKERVCVNPEVLAQAAQDLNIQGRQGPTSWRYAVKGLQFDALYDGHIQPKAKRPILSTTLDISAAGDIKNNKHDPFSYLEVNFVTSCEIGGEVYKDAWHFDRHITGNKAEADAAPSNPEAVHPLYHLQRGGHRLKDLGDDVGHTLVLDPPRIAHPPLDIVLAVDFLVSNYCGSDWQVLKSETAYSNSVKRSQEIFWKPYVKTWCANYETPRSVVSSEASELIPTLS